MTAFQWDAYRPLGKPYVFQFQLPPLDVTWGGGKGPVSPPDVTSRVGYPRGAGMSREYPKPHVQGVCTVAGGKYASDIQVKISAMVGEIFAFKVFGPS